MAVNNPQITLDEVYWWLNFSSANSLRPPMRVWLARLSEAEKAGNRQESARICQQFIDKEFQYLPNPIRERVERLQNALKIWMPRDIEEAHKKFYECCGSYIRTPIYTYVMNMREAVDQDTANAWNLLEQLYSMKNKITDELEAGEALVECGWAAYKMQNRMRAVMLFEEANRRYSSRAHQIAVVYCMIGCVYWELNEQNKALVAWRNSVSKFETLASQRLNPTEADPIWYYEVLKRLDVSLQYIIGMKDTNRAFAAVTARMAAKDELAPGGAAPGGQAATTTARAGETPADQQGQKTSESVKTQVEEESYITYTADLLEALPILAEVPAGPWKQTHGDPNIIGQVEIGQVLIDNQPHYVKNLRGGGRIISLSSIGKHVVVKITGDSMNNAQPTPIEDGDFVLLRRQNTAHAGDIVVAKIYDGVTRASLATIKRFLIDGHPLLKAESTESKYGKLDEDFQIDGIAVAVFKPVQKNSKSDTKPS